MERTIPQPGDQQPEIPPKAQTREPMPLADQPSPTSDAPPEKVGMAGGVTQIVPAELSGAEKVAVNERITAMNDLTEMTAQQMAMMGLRGQSPEAVLIVTVYTQVRHLQAMFDGLCDLLLSAQGLVAVSTEATKTDPNAGDIGLSPLNRLNYLKVGTLKAEQASAMIRRQILSQGSGGMPGKGKGS
jgi:hypothetical protein